jgi:lipid-binding SYLF domain-containing protein
MKTLFVAVLALLLAVPALAEDKEKKETERVEESAVVLKEILNIPEGIPKDLLDKSVCVVVYPSVKKAAFIVGGSYGRGVITCRKGKEFTGGWSAPAMFALEGGSFGLQIGAQATDFVLLIMNEGGANSVMSSKVKLGADASAVAGPVGRDASAETDVVLRAENPFLLTGQRTIRRHLTRRFDVAFRRRWQ